MIPPQVILTILRPCTTGGTKEGGESAKGHRGQRSQDEDAEKWNDVGEGDRERAKGNSLGLFLQIVLLQTLAG